MRRAIIAPKEIEKIKGTVKSYYLRVKEDVREVNENYLEYMRKLGLTRSRKLFVGFILAPDKNFFYFENVMKGEGRPREAVFEMRKKSGQNMPRIRPTSSLEVFSESLILTSEGLDIDTEKFLKVFKERSKSMRGNVFKRQQLVKRYVDEIFQGQQVTETEFKKLFTIKDGRFRINEKSICEETELRFYSRQPFEEKTPEDIEPNDIIFPNIPEKPHF